MSASLVRKSLQLVDSNNTKDHRKKRGSSNQQKSHFLTKSILKKGKKEKVNLLQVQKKLTVEDIKRELRNKQNKLQENVEKLKKLHKSVELDPETTQLILERAIQKRPVSIQSTQKEKPEESIFTEQDLKDIEEEYYKE
ncbi:uncharacterized protein LOC123298288 [Chrysoperla carnea]|uniref:uncharacterized protein LOC123298288 n=1 Tax=Chrysoperla carnea TaxID=189513 RepID=UPI001D078ED9|nr:uncharacterized protein LOC123298288 [Chrysoperla carnea]